MVWRDGEIPPETPSREQRPSAQAAVERKDEEETVMDAFERRAKTLMSSLGRTAQDSGHGV